MKIGVLSDSHKKTEIATSAIRLLKAKGADILIHAGDIVEVKTLEDLKKSKLPYYAVIGNNDTHLKPLKRRYKLVEEPFYFDFNGVEFKLAHYPVFLQNDVKINIFGHTHYFKAEIYGKTLYLNPGEICARKKPLSECAMVEYDGITFKVTKFETKPNKLEWKDIKVI